ncbi:MAG: hypothetical protein CMJ49_08270 [Planctomycetaceae bacterium]|nr:hypothetical protein [Planctomycetaceae bacterium]
MTDSPDWTWQDGWILMSLFLAHGESGAALHEIIAMADATNHAIPTPKELNSAFTKFTQRDLVEVIDERYVLAAEHLPGIKKAHDGRGGLFKSSDKGCKWLSKANLTLSNDRVIELSDTEVTAAYWQYRKESEQRKPR